MKKSTLLIALFIVFSVSDCFSFVEGPESMVYYPRWNAYIVANLGMMDYNTGDDPGFISVLYKGQIYGGAQAQTYKNYEIQNPKGLLIEGDILFFCNLNVLWGLNLTNYKIEYHIQLNKEFVKPTLCGLSKVNNFIYVTDRANNTIYKVNLIDSSFTDLKLNNVIIAPRCIYYDKILKKNIFVTQEKKSCIYSLDPSNDSVELLKTTDIENMYGITKDKRGDYYISAWGTGGNYQSKVYKYNGNFNVEPIIVKDSLTYVSSIYYNEILDEIAVPELKYFGSTYKMYEDKDLFFINFSEIPMPGIPKLVYPAENEIDVVPSPELQWEKLQYVNFYEFQISDSANFPTKRTISGVPINNYFQIATLMENTKYYWRVRTQNRSGISNWSPLGTFTTGVRQLAPPVSDTINKDYTPVSVLPVFSWHSNGADSYNLQIYEEKYSIDKKGDNPQVIPDVINPDYTFDNITDTVYKMTTKLNEGTDYYWRVRGIKDNKYSQWSQLLLFRTEGTNSIAFDDNDKRLTVFSNPNESFATVNFSLGYESVVNVMLINPISLETKIIYTNYEDKPEHSFIFSHNELPSGIYFIVVKTDRETLHRKILVVK